MAIVGHFEAAEVLTDTVRSLWKIAGEHSFLNKDQFFAYFGRVCVGSAWRVASPAPLQQRLGLGEIREYDRDYMPPQSMEYMSEDHAAVLAMSDRGLWPNGSGGWLG